MTLIQVPQQSQYTEEIRLGNSTSCDPIFFKVLADGLAPLIYPPDPFRLARPVRPFVGYFDLRKDSLFCWYTATRHFLYGARGG